MSALGSTEKWTFGIAFVCFVAIGAYRVIAGLELLYWALLNCLAIIPLLWPWLLKKLGQHARSLPPEMREMLQADRIPFWWRYIEAYLVVAAIAWVALLLATSVPSIPHKVGLFILIFDCAGPVLIVGITTLLKHFGGLGSPKGA